MSTILDFSKFEFSAEQIRNINELAYEKILEAPELALLHTIYPGIVYDKEIGFITEGGLVGVKGQGCEPTPQDWDVGTRKVLWQPKDWEVFISECYKELEQTAAVYALNLHTRIADLTDTDYFAILVEVLVKAVKKAIFRIIWFNDANAKNVSDGGIITDGVDTQYFDIIDGLFLQLETDVVGTPRNIAINANAEASKADQFNNFTPQDAYDLLSAMYYALPVEARGSDNVKFLVTQSIADKYQQFLMGKGIESTYKNLVEGVPALSFNGLEVVPMPLWDSMIQQYNDLGATFYKPHRAVLAEKANIAVGFPGEEAFGEVDMWYDKTSRKSHILVMDKIDAKIINPDRVVFAE